MIEIHQRGRSRHVLTDSEGYAALKRVFTEAKTKHPMDPRHPYTAMTGLAVYINECPCTPENVDGLS